MYSERNTYTYQSTTHNSPRDKLNGTRLRKERSCNYLKRAMTGIQEIGINPKKSNEVAINVYVRIKPCEEMNNDFSLRFKNNSLAVFKNKNSGNLL